MALRSQLRPWGCPEPFPSCSIYLELRLPTHFTPTVPLSPQMPVQISDNALGRDDSSVCLSQNIHCELSIHLPHRITLPPPVTHPLTSPPEDTALIFLKVNTAKPLPQLKIFPLCHPHIGENIITQDDLCTDPSWSDYHILHPILSHSPPP